MIEGSCARVENSGDSLRCVIGDFVRDCSATVGDTAADGHQSLAKVLSL